MRQSALCCEGAAGRAGSSDADVSAVKDYEEMEELCAGGASDDARYGGILGKNAPRGGVLSIVLAGGE
jgi:hypothetical protein